MLTTSCHRGPGTSRPASDTTCIGHTCRCIGWSMGLELIRVHSSTVPTRTRWSVRSASNGRPSIVKDIICPGPRMPPIIPPMPMPMAKSRVRRAATGSSRRSRSTGPGGTGPASAARSPVTSRVSSSIGSSVPGPSPGIAPPIMPSMLPRSTGAAVRVEAPSRVSTSSSTRLPGARVISVSSTGSGRRPMSRPSSRTVWPSRVRRRYRDGQALTTRHSSRSPGAAVAWGRTWPLTSTVSPSRPIIRCGGETSARFPESSRVRSETTSTRSRATGTGSGSSTTMAP